MSAYLPPTLNNGVLNNVYNPADYGSSSSGFLKLSGGAVTGDLTVQKRYKDKSPTILYGKTYRYRVDL